MLKRTVGRLLLLGVGFLLSYLITPPSPPDPVQRFMVCEYLDGERRIVIALEPAACAVEVPSQMKFSRPDSIVPANSWKFGTDTPNEEVFKKGAAKAF